MTDSEDIAGVAGQLADLTHGVEEMKNQLETMRLQAETQQSRADTQQERMTSRPESSPRSVTVCRLRQGRCGSRSDRPFGKDKTNPIGHSVAVPPEGDKSTHMWQELWGFEGVVAAAGLSTFSRHRLPLRPALRAKLTRPCGFGSATRIFFLRSAITYRSRG